MSHLIVTAFSVPKELSTDVLNSQDTPDSTTHSSDQNIQPITMNVTTLHSCYLCWRHAEHEYPTTPCFLAGKFYPSETRRLCKMHYRQVWEVMLESLKGRVQTQECLQEEEYEPYYSRADEMADQANADYWDEEARGGRVA